MKRYEKAPSKRTKQSTPLLQGLLLLAHTWVACATAPVPAPLPAPHPANSAFSLAPTHETRDPASASASSSSSRTSPPAGLSDAQKFRLFFRDILLVTASNSGTEPVSPDSIRQVLASHPEVLRWALEGKDWHRLFEDADLSQSSSPTGASAPLALPIPKPVADTWLTTLEQTSELERLQALRQVPDSYFEKIAEQAQILVSGYALDESPAVRILASPKSGLGVTDENLAKFLEKVLPRFYKKLNTADKARILAGQLELPPKALEEQQLSALLQSSGPCIQKLFQLIGRDVKNPKLQSAMNALQSEIRPFPGEQALKTIESRYGKSADQLFKTFDQKPLAAASVGQVHLAELSDGQRVVVKVRRPQLRERANREIQELLAAASSEPAAHEMLKKVGQTVLDELNFRNEARYLALGAVYERPELGISVANLIPTFEPHEDLLVSRLAPGAKISRGAATTRDTAMRIHALSTLLEIWFDEVIFGRGFFHGDLHPGNLFFEENAQMPSGYRLTLIDFGNAGALGTLERRAFLNLVLSAQTPQPQKVLAALEGIGTVPPEKRNLLLAAYQRIYELESDATARIDRFLMVSIESGMEIPSSFIAFNRARLFLEKELLSLIKLHRELAPHLQIPGKTPSQIYRKVATTRISTSLFHGLFSQKAKNAQIVTSKMLLEALRDQLFYRASKFGAKCVDSFRELANELNAP